MRLNLYLAKCGVASRRGADKIINEGRVLINGAPALVGASVEDGDIVELDNQVITPQSDTIVLAVNKPIGVVCTEAHFKGEKTLSKLINYPTRVFGIGRLDKDSEGLILMTNDGTLAQEISKSANAHEKEYEVRVEKPVTAEFLEAMRGGVDIVLDDDAHNGQVVTTRPCKVRKLDAYTFRIILTQGFNRQIRRMVRALDYHVRSLKRIRVMSVELGDLKSGSYRQLSPDEISELIKATKSK